MAVEIQKKKSKKDRKDKKEKRVENGETKIDSQEGAKKRKEVEKDDAKVVETSEEPIKKVAKTNSAPGSYQEHPEVTALTKEDVQKFREENAITFSGDKEFNPILKFQYAGFTDSIMDFCKGFETPTPIQSSCWPIILSNRDVVGIAQTGSGKTLAFTLPGFMHIIAKNRVKAKTPTVLVLAPTRELAMQSHEISEQAGKLVGLNSVCIYGGVPKDAQRRSIKSGAQVIVATPGRLLDLIEDGTIDISMVSYVVLDEADRMLDFGFEPAIRALLGKVQPSHQTVMLSATWPESIRKLANEFLSQPIMVTIGSEDLAVSHNVHQIVEVLDDQYLKEKRLTELLGKYHKSRDNRVLVFALYKKEAARIEQTLRYKGFKVACIQGDLSQNQRTEALARFKDGTCPLLIATDVAARGLDIPKVEYVINYTFPLTIDDYVHRIGRTGRANNKGVSHTFFTPHDKGHSGELINVLKSAGQVVPDELLKFGTTVKKKEHKAYGAFFKDIDSSVKPTKIKFDD